MDSRDEEIYRKHADELIRFATTLVGAGSAEDVFSGAILKALSSHSWPSVTEHRAYLFRAVLNEALGIRRSDRRRSLRETTAAPHECVENAQDSVEVADAMSRLSVRQRSVLYLAYWLDFTGVPPQAGQRLTGCLRYGMSAYVISSYEVVNRDSFLAYPGPAVASIRAHGGEILAADLTSEVLEGSAPPVTVIIKFADKSAARSWYESTDYQALAPLRRENTVGNVVLLDDDVTAARALR